MNELDIIVSQLSVLVSLCLAIYMYRYYYIKEQKGEK